MKTPARQELLFICGNLAVLLFLTLKGPILISDSASYLSLAPYRTPIYPLFLAGLNLLSPTHFLALAAFIQTALTLVAATLFCLELKKRCSWSARSTLLTYLLIILPLFKLPLCPLCQETGNTIGTEGLAYPAFLAFCAIGLRALCESGFKNLLLLSFTASLCAAIRPQLLFCYPAVLFVLFAAWRNKTVAPLKLVAGLLALLVFHGLFSLGHKIYSGFTPNPFPRQQLLTTILHVSEPEDCALFDNSQDSATIKAVFTRIEELKAFSGQRHMFQRSLAKQQEQSFNPICWLALHSAFDSALEKNLPEKERMRRLNNAYGRMLTVLVPAKKSELAKFYLLMLWQHSSLLLLSAFALMIFFMRVYDLNKMENRFALMCWLTASSNLLMLIMSATVADRYLIYTRPLLIISFMVLFYSWRKPRDAA